MVNMWMDITHFILDILIWVWLLYLIEKGDKDE